MTIEIKPEPQKITIPIKCSTIRSARDTIESIIATPFIVIFKIFDYKVLGYEMGLLLMGLFGVLFVAFVCAICFIGFFTHLWGYPFGFIIGCIITMICTFMLYVSSNSDIKIVCKEG